MANHHRGNEHNVPKVEVDLKPTHEDLVRVSEEKVLSQTIPWEGYARANLIQDWQCELIKKYDKKTAEVRASLLQKEGEIYAELFLDLLSLIAKEDTVQYLLCIIDQTLNEKPTNYQLYLQLEAKKSGYPFQPLIRLKNFLLLTMVHRILNRDNADWFSYSKAIKVVTTLMCSSKTQIPEENVKFVSHWIREQLRKQDEKEIFSAVSALQRLVKKEEFRPYYATDQGLELLAMLVKTRGKNIQLLYQVLFCIWMLSYNKTVGAQLESSRVIPHLVDTLKTEGKEKVIRMIIAALRNFLDIGNNNEQMIDAGIVKPLEHLTNKSWADEDIVNDLAALQESLQKNIVLLSSFDCYKKELLSGKLEWSTVHRSEKFWRENSHRLEEDQYKLLLVLKDLLTSTPDPTVLCVACHDIGEFARFHPRGKIIIQQLGIKLPLMGLMEGKDPEVRRYALLAVQKLMVTNWEYLGAASQ